VRKLFVHVDGASRGNPGEAAIGVLLTDEHGNTIEEVSELIGQATNNVAEYRALIEGVRRALNYLPEEAIFLTDNELVANQINGLYRVREPHLQHLNQRVLELLSRLPRWRVNYIEREANYKAHRLAMRAFRERTRQERERSRLLNEIEDVLRDLDLDDLRRVLSYANSLRAQKP
jgi:ribonuclease HI